MFDVHAPGALQPMRGRVRTGRRLAQAASVAHTGWARSGVMGLAIMDRGRIQRQERSGEGNEGGMGPASQASGGSLRREVGSRRAKVLVRGSCSNQRQGCPPAAKASFRRQNQWTISLIHLSVHGRNDPRAGFAPVRPPLAVSKASRALAGHVISSLCSTDYCTLVPETRTV
nr:hypothetical protein CFP56_04330 [Quercus suber]